MNKRLLSLFVVSVLLCFLFIEGLEEKNSDEQSECIILIKGLDEDGKLEVDIKKGKEDTEPKRVKFAKKNCYVVVSSEFENAYALQDNTLAELLCKNKCIVDCNGSANDKYILAVCTVRNIENVILRYMFSWMFKDKKYIVYCEDANAISRKVQHKQDFFGLFSHSEATKIEILSCGSNITNMSSMFFDCISLESLNLSNFNTENVTNMSGMFHNCSSLEKLDLSKFDTSNVTDMSFMFYKCSSLESINLSQCETKNVTDMSFMFSYCSSLKTIDLSNFNTQNVTDMSSMFAFCYSLTSILSQNFDTNKVTDMSYMFACCVSLEELDLSNFVTNEVTDMSWMFGVCESLQNINLSNFNTANVTNMSNMFSDCSSLESLNLSNFDTNKVTDMSCMFQDCFKDNATFICTVAVLSKITDPDKKACFKIKGKAKTVIEKDKNSNNIYSCIVNGGKIIEVKEYEVA